MTTIHYSTSKNNKRFEQIIRENERKRMENEILKFTKLLLQKTVGIIISVFSVIALIKGFFSDGIIKNDITFLFVIIPLGLYIIFTKKIFF